MHHTTAGDGVFSRLDGNEISLVDLKSNTTRILISTYDVKDVSFTTCPENSQDSALF